MVRMLDSETGNSALAELILHVLPRDPEAMGFKRLPTTASTLDYEFDTGSRKKLFVYCTVTEADGVRWLLLQIGKQPGEAAFEDIAYVRRAFLGMDVPALLYYPNDPGAVPLSINRVNLWSPLDRVALPGGIFERQKT